jgi:ATP-binding cassette subfamily A (ABC1) protein 3
MSYKATLKSKLICSLFPQNALFLGAEVLTNAETYMIPITLENFGSVSYYKYTLLYSLLFMVIDFVLFFLIAIYFDNVLPTAGGSKKHPLYFLLPSYWCPKSRKLDKSKPLLEEKADPYIEQVSEQLKSQDTSSNSIKLTNLTKSFEELIAVNKISISLYSGQIFALLGQNGAGKTTTISMLAGMLEPTNGMIEIFGHDTALNEDYLKKIIGLCPQNDILFNELTIEEHFYVIGAFRGISQQNIKIESDKLIQEFGINDKRKALAKSLSGGQKRRLSLCIAFLGNPKFVLLDEPTSGLDTTGRKELWERLKDYKAGRVILLTTHYMEEADFLGDRIAIMANGDIKVLGSSLFLKSKFGIGYKLQVNVIGAHEDIDKLIAQFTECNQFKELGHSIEYPIPSLCLQYVFNIETKTFLIFLMSWKAEKQSWEFNLISYWPLRWRMFSSKSAQKKALKRPHLQFLNLRHPSIMQERHLAPLCFVLLSRKECWKQ